MSNKKAFKRHPSAIAWDFWLASEEGQKAANMSTLVSSREAAGLYLINRLRAAFLEGAKVRDVLCDKCGRRYVAPWEDDQHGNVCKPYYEIAAAEQEGK